MSFISFTHAQDCDLDAGTITTADPTEICAGDGDGDPINVSVSGTIAGERSAWVITNPEGQILGLPPGPPFDLEGAGEGTCLIWHLVYDDPLDGLKVGLNANELDGCHDLSNAITVVRNGVDGGKIIGQGSRFICAGDGEDDFVDVTLSGNVGEGSAWVITDENLNILGLPAAPPFNFEGAGGGVCLIWHASFNGDLTGVEVGANAADIQGCYDLSNALRVVRRGVNGGEISTDDPTSFCVGDGSPNFVTPTVTGNEGAYNVWIVTDEDGNMLAFPKRFPIDFEGAGDGTCIIWHVSYMFGLKGIGLGNNIFELRGCFDLSNPIEINRNGSTTPIAGGTISTNDETNICAGDGQDDFIDVSLSGALGPNMSYVITNEDGEILALPEGPPFNFEGAGAGVCLIWHLSFEDGLIGAEVGLNAQDLDGCYSLSNPITVTRQSAVGGELSLLDGAREITICAGDGSGDPLDVLLTGNSGSNSAWVITDPDGNILGIPPGPPFDLDGAGAGTCLIWHLSFEDGLEGAEVGLNANELKGCYALSNPVTVTRIAAPDDLSGGKIITMNETTTCVGDGAPDFIFVDMEDNAGTNSQWVITDEDGNILALPDAPPFNFEGAGPGVCLIWHLSFEDGLVGATVGANAGDLQGCFSLSNSIAITRQEVAGGEIMFADSSTSYTICAGDETADPLDVSLSGNIGENSSWVITNEDFEILGLPAGPPFDLNGAGPGVCLIWHASSNGNLEGVEVGMNALNIDGCISLSNAISVTRLEAPFELLGGTISTDDPTEICAGDGTGDPINVTLEGAAGSNSGWVITDVDGNILGLPSGPPFDLDGAGTGVCLIWHISYEDGLDGVVVGGNANQLQGCYALSNPITVTRTGVNGGFLALRSGSTDTTICVNGEPDPLEVDVTGTDGTNAAWVITDMAGEILGLPAGPPFDLDGAGVGTCLIWYLRFEDGLVGAEVGLNAMNLEGCYDLSNPIMVVRVDQGPACGTTLFSEIENADQQKMMTLFPNPTTDELNVVLDFSSQSNTDFTIVDINGRIVRSVNRQGVYRGDRLRFDVSELNDGYYLLRIENEEHMSATSFIKN